MEKWFKTCLLLCLVGFLLEARPNESFGVEYLTGPWQNLTNEEVTQLVYPVWTYSTVPLSIVAFLVTDYFLYKPIIVIECLSFVIYFCLYIFGHGIQFMQAGEFFYACGSASSIAYTTYLYIQVPKDKFLLVTAYTSPTYTEASVMIGYGLAELLGQVLISTELCDYAELNYISFSVVLVATLISLFLPSASESIYFHRSRVVKSGTSFKINDSEKSPSSADVEPVLEKSKISPWRLLWIDFTYSFSTAYIIKWSFWLAITDCFYYLAFGYIQPLWNIIDTEEVVLNGAVEAIHTLLSGLAVLAIGYTSKVDWNVYGNLLIAISATTEGGLLVLMAVTNNIWVNYAAYILFNIILNVSFTIGCAEVAKGLKEESYGFIFGIVAFMGVILEAIITIIIVSEIGFGLPPRGQFLFHGCCLGFTGIVFLVITAYQNGKANHLN